MSCFCVLQAGGDQKGPGWNKLTPDWGDVCVLFTDHHPGEAVQHSGESKIKNKVLHFFCFVKLVDQI